MELVGADLPVRQDTAEVAAKPNVSSYVYAGAETLTDVTTLALILY